MSVKLRYREYKDGSKIPYLDIYQKGTRVRECLPNLRLKKPSNKRDREINKELTIQAETIAAKRAMGLQNQLSGLFDNGKLKENFVAFIDEYIKFYTKKDKRIVKAARDRFVSFCKTKGVESLSIAGLNKRLFVEFRDYLLVEMNGETPANYFKKIKQVVESLVQSGVLYVNPCTGIKISRNTTIRKDILSIEELHLLYNSKVGNNEVRRSFLFCCYTGLRFCDIKSLTFGNIRGDILSITQQKTGVKVEVPLHKQALELISVGDANQLVFNLPSHTACNKALSSWVKSVNIDKHITWHCARHTFGTLLVHMGCDVQTASSLIGHTSLHYTQRYLRDSPNLRIQAINNLPKLG
jgi:integrase/recombinase XerD